MNIGELLGAGLLGGVGNAAKGAGDRLREAAKQKRAMALEDRADARAEIANDNAVEAAKQRRIFDAREGRLDRTQQTTIQDDAQDFTGGEKEKDRTQQTTIQSNQQTFTGGEKEKDRTQQTTIQSNQQDFTGGEKEKDRTQQTTIQGNQQTFTAGEKEKDRTQQTTIQGNQQTFTAGENQKDRDASFEKQRRQYKAELLKIKAANVGEIKNFFDEKTGLVQPHERMVDGSWEPRGGAQAPDASTSKGLTLQVVYNDKGEEVKGYMSGKDFVQVGGAKAVKAGTEKEALAYFTSQAKYILGGAQNSFMAAKLTDDDTKLMSEWIPEAEAAFRANPTTSLSQIVKNIMFKPWVLDDADITDADLNAGDSQASAAGSGALTPMQYARQIATKRQPEFIKAQNKYDAFMAAGTDPAPVFKMMRKMGYDPDLLTKK